MFYSGKRAGNTGLLNPTQPLQMRLQILPNDKELKILAIIYEQYVQYFQMTLPSLYGNPIALAWNQHASES